MDKYRGWCFTINNPTERDKNAISVLKCRYIVVGEEVGEGGTPHLQGYVYFDSQRARGPTQKKLGGRAHLEAAVGSCEANREYCSKDGNILREDGEPPAQGARTDLSAMYDILKETGSIKQALECSDAPNLQQIRAVECYAQYFVKKREWKPTVKWFFGSTGTGKTRLAFEEAGEDCWMSAGKLRWFQGYDGHENVILDDFRVDSCEVNFLLRLLDRYPMQVEVKGSSRQFLARNIWITSDRAPNMMWSGKDLEQVVRRLDVIHEMDQKSGVILDPDFS